MRIKNWDKWQSYRKDRGQPPWIKLHRALMRDPNWVSLTDSQRGQLVSMWMLAADRDGEIPDDTKVLKKLCFMESDPDLKVFEGHGFLQHGCQHGVKVASSGCQGGVNMSHQSRVEESRVEESRGDKRREEDTGAKNAPDTDTTAVGVLVNPPKNGQLIDKPKTPQAEFVEKFKVSYESQTGQPYKFKREHFVIAAKLLKDYGQEQVVTKVKLLGAMCRDRSVWFTQGGWSDFSIEKLSSMWNQIIPEAREETVQEKENRLREELAEKRRVENERIASVMGRK